MGRSALGKLFLFQRRLLGLAVASHLRFQVSEFRALHTGGLGIFFESRAAF